MTPLTLSKRQIAKIERPYWTKFWGARCKVKPKFVQGIVGNGDRLIYLTPLMTRPHWYAIRVDKSWDLSNFGEGDWLCDHLDEICQAIEDEYGYYYDGHSSEYDYTDGDYPGWPVFFNEGCSWGELDPREFGIQLNVKP